MKKKFIWLIFIFSGVLGFLFSLYMHRNIFSTTQTIETFHYPATFVKQLTHDPAAGKKIFKEFCATCHAATPFIDIHAPRIGNKKDWSIRRRLGMQQLLKMTIDGVGAMPARGGCFECSDEQLRKAIAYMLEQSY